MTIRQLLFRSGDPYYVTATADDDGVYVRDGERLYRLAVTRGDDD